MSECSQNCIFEIPHKIDASRYKKVPIKKFDSINSQRMADILNFVYQINNKYQRHEMVKLSEGFVHVVDELFRKKFVSKQNS